MGRSGGVGACGIIKLIPTHALGCTDFLVISNMHMGGPILDGQGAIFDGLLPQIFYLLLSLGFFFRGVVQTF